MKLHKLILVLNIIVGGYGIANGKVIAQQEFERICLSGEHTNVSCDCIYRQLEQVYSPQIIQRLKHVSLQSPDLPQDFAPTMLSIIRRCDKTPMG